MSDIGSITPLTGANPAFARDGGVRPAPPPPATVQNAVGGVPLTNTQSSVNQSPYAGNAGQRRDSDPNSQRSKPADSDSTRLTLNETVDRLNRSMNARNTQLRFEVDDEFQEMVIRITDRETEEVIMQIPREEALALAKFFSELLENQQSQGLTALGGQHSTESGRLRVEGQLFRTTV